MKRRRKGRTDYSSDLEADWKSVVSLDLDPIEENLENGGVNYEEKNLWKGIFWRVLETKNQRISSRIQN